MKIKIKKVIGLQTLLMWLGLFCVVSYALLEHASIPIPAVSSVKMPLLYVGGVCLIFQYNTLLKNVLKKRYFYILLILLIMCVLLLCSMILNENVLIGFSPVRTTVRLILYLIELFALMIVLAEKGHSKAVLNMIYRYVLILVIATDFLLFTGFLRFDVGIHGYYLIGTKFTVVYMHLNLLTLWLVRHWKRDRIRHMPKWKVWVIAVILVLISLRVNCMSGVLGGCIFVLLLLWLSSGKNKTWKLTSPMVVFLCSFGSTFFAFIANFIMSIPFIHRFVESVLNRSTTLTGRLYIYQDFVYKMQSKWLFGYGYGSGNMAAMRLFGYDNVQNAVLHWVLQGGILTTAALIALMIAVMRMISKSRVDRRISIEPLLALVYTYIVLGTIEITYSMSFIMWIALLFMIQNDRNNASC